MVHPCLKRGRPARLPRLLRQVLQASGVTRPIHVVPPAVNTTLYDPTRHSPLPLPAGTQVGGAGGRRGESGREQRDDERATCMHCGLGGTGRNGGGVGHDVAAHACAVHVGVGVGGHMGCCVWACWGGPAALNGQGGSGTACQLPSTTTTTACCQPIMVASKLGCVCTH